MRKNIGFILILMLGMCACSKETSSPKPYGYFRIFIPDTAYMPLDEYDASFANHPYAFALSQNATVTCNEKDSNWINIYYPVLDATIHCTYLPVKNNLDTLLNDANDFVYRHSSFASQIPTREYVNQEEKVYGVMFELDGNTASSCQFFLTDSTRHFFRGSVYFNSCAPNADSLAPLNNYLRTDVIKMVETFRWK